MENLDTYLVQGFKDELEKDAKFIGTGIVAKGRKFFTGFKKGKPAKDAESIGKSLREVSDKALDYTKKNKGALGIGAAGGVAVTGAGAIALKD